MGRPVLNKSQVDPGVRSSTLGWIAVALVTFVGSFVALFLAGESVPQGALEPGHLLQLAVVLGIGVLAVAVRRAGVVYVLPGLAALYVFRLSGGLLVGVPLIAAGVLFYLGHPRPTNRAYWVVIGVPLLVAFITAGAAMMAG